MNNTNDSTNEEDQSTTPVSNYLALMETTRPLVITKGTAPSSRLLIFRDQAIPLETGECREEAVLKRGEIIHGDLPDQRVTNDEGPTAATDLDIRSSNLKIRIYLGMS
jgi:hypothetical protein